METRRKVIILVAVAAGLGALGYSQYASASHIGVEVTQSRLVEETASGSSYALELEFDNPSLLYLTAGETEFMVTADGQRIGDGRLEAFTLPAMDSAAVSGTFVVDPEGGTYEGEEPDVRIMGVTTYDVLFTTVDVPFVYRPTGEQARAFIESR